MPGISSEILISLRNLLSDFEQLDSNQALRNLFVDERIVLWRNRLPQVDSLMGRVDALIHYLHDKKNSNGTSGMVLFLEVLADTLHSSDARYVDLKQVLQKLSQTGTVVSPTPRERLEKPAWLEKADEAVSSEKQEQPEPGALLRESDSVEANHLAKKKDFFISYNRHDKQIAEWIAWQLEEAGYTTVIQAWDFRPGGNFVADMQNAAANVERTIAVLSPDYLASQLTQPEWNAAFAQDPMGKDGLLLPVRVRECELTGLLPQIVYIDLVGLSEEDAVLALLSGVKRGRAKPDSKPEFSTSS